MKRWQIHKTLLGKSYANLLVLVQDSINKQNYEIVTQKNYKQPI